MPGRSDGPLRGKSLGAITSQGMVKALLSRLRPTVIPIPIVDGSLCGPAFASWLRRRKCKLLSNNTSNPVKDVPEADSARQKS